MSNPAASQLSPGTPEKKADVPGPTRTQPPKILADETLTDGMAILASAHAGLAWFLSRDESERPLVRFHARDCSKLPPTELQEQKRASGYISLTESALGNREVAIVGGCSAEAVAQRSRSTPAQPCSLKMYILVHEAAALPDAMAAAANAAILCFSRHEQLPEMDEWLNASFRKVICRASDNDLAHAMKHDNFAAVSGDSSSPPLAVAFSPRSSWPKMFKFLQLYR